MSIEWLAELLRTINNYKLVKYLLMVQTLLLSGILIIFYFQNQAFYSLSTSKLVLFALSITVPIFMINMAMGQICKFSSNNFEEKIEILLIFSGLMTSLTLYSSIIWSCNLKLNFSGFLKVLLIEEILLLILISIGAYFKKFSQYIIQKLKKKHYP